MQSSRGTGINRWWRYQEESVPGGGRVMVNLGTGNMLLQDDDMSVPHKGVSLALRRTYNSQSEHDVAGTDGTPPSMYGNGWTNTFDAHVVSAPGQASVYDIDGARYDYVTTDLSAGYTPVTAGSPAALYWDGGCGLFWVKKRSHTIYYFHSDAAPGCAATLGGRAGRLYQIIGRNLNTYLTFSYAWDNGNASTSGKISTIWVQAESGLTTTLSFGDVSGHRLLQQILYPDGVTSVSYGYDGAGNLTVVSRPPNNASGIRPTQSFGYLTLGADSVMWYAAPPRWNATCGPSSCGSDGAYPVFGYAGTSAASSTMNSIQHNGVVNPPVADGTSSGVIQSGYPTTAYVYLTEYYTTGVANPTFRDTDGHMMNWVVDGRGRPTQTQECTASANHGQQCTGTWLVMNETWDADNNLTSETEPRGNETDYAYDANGNTIAVGEPYATTSQGSFKPTKLYDYDPYDNVVGYCDETETHTANADWVSGFASQSDSLCASQAGAVPHWRATFSYPGYEPAGQLQSMTTPLGYTRQFAYAAAQQGGNDYGLPTSVTGDSFAQLDSTTITPTQSFWYDAQGGLRCYSKGMGTYVLSYDSLGRVISEADPDDSSANASSMCGKNTGHPGWNTQTTTTYFPDGSVQSVQTPSERAFGVSTTYTHDLDGNVLTETAHHGCVPNQTCPPGTTQKWYDGVDRLVEVQQPWDPRSYVWPSTLPYDGSPSRTRYMYDLSAGGTVSLAGSSAFHAYGNLFKTQTYVSTADLGPPGFTDKSGSAFDALDREVTKFSYAINTNTVEQTQLQYDGGAPAAPGLLTQKTNPTGESVSYLYDEHARIQKQTYVGDNGVTPSETMSYDPDGKVVAVTSSQFGTQQYSYDGDGRLLNSTEPSGGGATGAAQISYSYYGDGKRSGISVRSPGLTQANALAYSYRTDGVLQTQTMNAFAGGSWTKSYTDAGRLRTVGGVDSQARAYDTTGQLQSYAAGGSTISYTHDPEGSPLSEALPSIWPAGASGPVSVTRYSTINVRGELIDDTPPGTAPGAYLTAHRSKTDNGCMGRQVVQNDGTYDPLAVPSQDLRQCVVTASGSMSSTDYNGGSYPSGHTTTFAFDNGGRLSRTRETISFFFQGAPRTDPQDPIGPTWARTTLSTTTTTYDAENHTIGRHLVARSTRSNPDQGTSTTTTTDTPATTIGWGPNGHPIIIHDPTQATVAAQNATLHWDGDMVLFVTDANGNVLDFKAGLDAEITPQDTSWAGLTVYDRDAAGVIVNSSNATGNSGLVPLDDNDGSGIGAAGTPGFKASASVQAQYLRPDGFKVGDIQINGVRAFDPKLGAWTTPDAFEGDIHDPASQQKYMWNRGNAVDYSDPSGYDACVSGFCIPTTAIGRGAVGAGRAAVAAGRAAASRAGAAALRMVPGVGTVSLFLYLSGTLSSGTLYVGSNPRQSSGKRVITQAPADGSSPEDVFDKAGGGKGTVTQPDGTKVAPNGVRLRPATPTKGARVDIPAHGQSAPEGVHWPDPPEVH